MIKIYHYTDKKIQDKIKVKYFAENHFTFNDKKVSSVKRSFFYTEKNPSEYLKTIKISNGKDYSTFELNITDEIYEKIKNILINTIE